MNTKITLLFLLIGLVAFGQKIPKDKKQLIASVESHKEELISISDQIWANAEIAFQ